MNLFQMSSLLLLYGLLILYFAIIVSIFICAEIVSPWNLLILGIVFYRYQTIPEMIDVIKENHYFIKRLNGKC